MRRNRLWKYLSKSSNRDNFETIETPKASQYCGNCGEKISNGDKFCGKCGQTIAKTNGISTTLPHKSKFKRILRAMLKTAITIGYFIALVALIVVFRSEAQVYDEHYEREEPYRKALYSNYGLYSDDSLENAIRVYRYINFNTNSIYKKEICNKLIKIFEKHAESDPWITFALADTYAAIGNHDKEAYWYLQSAKLGNSGAMNNLAVCYEVGEGVKKDQKKALEYIRMAAYNGDMIGAYNYACRFEIGVYKRYESVWIKEPDCYDCKHKGDKCEKHTYIIGKELILKANMDSARYWWQKAADMGMEDAKDKLMKIYD